MGKTMTFPVTTQRQDSAIDEMLRQYVRRHGEGAFALLSAIEDIDAAAALTAIKEELGRTDGAPDPDLIRARLNHLQATFEDTGFGSLVECARYYAGPDILGAWNFQGARIAELIQNCGARSVPAVPPR